MFAAAWPRIVSAAATARTLGAKTTAFVDPVPRADVANSDCHAAIVRCVAS
jgi:hypothetical protein